MEKLILKTFLSLLFASFWHRKILKYYFIDCFKISGNQIIKGPRKGGYVKVFWKYFSTKR